jgi:hypothetical protein
MRRGLSTAKNVNFLLALSGCKHGSLSNEQLN